MPTMFTVEEVAERWQVHRKTVYLMIQKGEIHVVRMGAAIRIPCSVVESFETSVPSTTEPAVMRPKGSSIEQGMPKRRWTPEQMEAEADALIDSFAARRKRSPFSGGALRKTTKQNVTRPANVQGSNNASQRRLPATEGSAIERGNVPPRTRYR